MSIDKRGDVYRVRFQIKKVKYNRDLPGYTFEQAKAHEAEARQSITDKINGKVVYTLEDALIRWLEGEASNLKSYNSLVKRIAIILPLMRDTPITKAADAARKIREMNPIIDGVERLSAATINRRLAILRRLVNLSWEWGWIESPIKIKLQSGETARHTYLSVQEVIRLAKLAPRIKWHIILAAFSGMREGEILSIEESSRFKDFAELKNTKNGKPRIVPLNPPAKRALERLNFEITYPMLRKDFEQARALANMPHVHFHDLRHTAASFMVKGEANMTAIRDVLGHSSLSVTSRYSHLNTKEIQKAVNKMVGRKKSK